MFDRALIGLIFLVGLWGLIRKRNLVKKVFGLSILNAAVVILFIMEGGKAGSSAPILERGVRDIVDPVPQALMLTAIVIGVCVTALALAMAYRLFKATGSLDIDEVRERLDERHS